MAASRTIHRPHAGAALAVMIWLAIHVGPASAARANEAAERPCIYQLFLRQFSNTNETWKPNGTLAENGVGKFSDLNDCALHSLREFGVTHLWLLGLLRQATATDYSSVGLPADDPDLLKGLAGSPFAIRDYFDVCPDYADNPARRLEEFRALVQRVHGQGLKVILDFVPNHVVRSYRSVVKPQSASASTTTGLASSRRATTSFTSRVSLRCICRP